MIVGNRARDFGQKKIGKGWSDLANLSLLRFGLENSNKIGQFFSGRAASSPSAVVVGVHVHIGVHVVIVVVVVIVIVVVDVDWNFEVMLISGWITQIVPSCLGPKLKIFSEDFTFQKHNSQRWGKGTFYREGVGTSNFTTTTGHFFQNIESVFLVDHNYEINKYHNIEIDKDHYYKNQDIKKNEKNIESLSFVWFSNFDEVILPME